MKGHALDCVFLLETLAKNSIPSNAHSQREYKQIYQLEREKRGREIEWREGVNVSFFFFVEKTVSLSIYNVSYAQVLWGRSCPLLSV